MKPIAPRLVLMAALLSGPLALAQTVTGEAAFEPCLSCHTREAGGPAAAGPSLHGIIGRTVGGDPAYDYSEALRSANQRGLVWDAAKLEQFLADPAAMFPGVWMSPPPLRDATERKLVVQFLVGRSGRR